MNSLICTFTVLLWPAFCIRSEILVPEDKSWISNDNFMTIMKLSFPYSTCCNVYLSGSIGDTLLHQFRRIYSSEYILNRSSQECNGYLLLGSSDEEIAAFMEKVQLQWRTEILILVDGYISNSSNIFDYSLYGNANINIVSISGIWKLSENHVKPRTFVKIDRYEEMRHNYENINLHGRKLYACSLYMPPMTYLNRTINKTIDGVQTEVFLVENDLERDGVEMRLFLIMAKKLNFTWTIKKTDGYGSLVNGTEWKGGMIQFLREHKADIAFGDLWLTQDTNIAAHLSKAWHQVRIKFLVPRPRRTISFWALCRPFSVGTWCLLVSVLLFYSLYTYTRAWIDPKFPKRFRNFLITLTDLIGYFLSSSESKTIANNKLQILLWRTAGWLIITAYCSSLAVRLATSEYEDRIDTIEQFLSANLTWGLISNKPSFRTYFDLTDPYSAQLPSRYRYVENDTQLRDFIAQSNYAILGIIIDNYFFSMDYVPNEQLKNYRLMKQSTEDYYIVFALQPWLLESVNRIVLLMNESGITTWHLRYILRKRDNHNLHEVFVEHDGFNGDAHVLGLRPLGSGFLLLLVGSSIATLVFCLELKHATRSTSIRQVLRNIDNKRRSCQDNTHNN